MKVNRKTQIKLMFTQKALNLATRIFGGDSEKAAEWMLMPNEYFFGDAPIDMIAAGEGQHLVNWLEERL